MASSSIPIRVDSDLFATAKMVGDVMDRSATQQLAHWARIGRELESSPAVSHSEIAAVLAGGRDYDDLNVKEQAIVRAEWAVRMAIRREDLNLAQTFASEGASWVELDDHGDVVTHGPSSARHDAA